MGEIADYVAGLGDAESRQAIEHLYQLVRTAVPDATEGTSYGMAALRYRGRPLFAVKAAKSHVSVFPFSPSVVDAVSDDLTGYDLSKGTIRFSLDSALPDQVVTRLVTLRSEEIDRALDR